MRLPSAVGCAAAAAVVRKKSDIDGCVETIGTSCNLFAVVMLKLSIVYVLVCVCVYVEALL